MSILRRSLTQSALLLLSIIGAGIAIYLTTVHYENAPLFCSSTGIIDCARVLASPYSLVPGTTIPITIPGLGWSTVSAILAGIGLYLGAAPRWLRITQFVLTLFGMFSVLYLVYAEIVLLHTICAWCTALHITILLMFLITLVQLQRGDPAQEPAFTEEVQPQAPTRSRK